MHIREVDPLALTFQVTFDAADPDRLAHFWANVLGYQLQPPPDGYADWEAFLAELNAPREKWDAASAIVDPDGIGPRIYFQKVPEPKSGKNRVHLDVNAGAGVPAEERHQRVNAEADRVESLGASKVRVGDDWSGYWIVMQDPEGNEFCVH